MRTGNERSPDGLEITRRTMIATRLRQVQSHLRPAAIATEQWARVDDILDDHQQAAFRTMPRRELAHHLCVLQHIQADGGPDDQELQQAALLHDIGKVSNGRSPSLLDRTLLVVLTRYRPTLLDRLTTNTRWWNRGLYLAEHHPALGAEVVGSLGCAPRTCELIARHAELDVTGDRALARLQRADSAC